MQDKTRPDRFRKLGVHAVLCVLVDDTQHRDVCAVAQAGKLRECILGLRAQACQFPEHEFHHIVGIPFGANASQVPGPSLVDMIEGEQSLLKECRKKLDREKWIAARLLMNQFREWLIVYMWPLQMLCSSRHFP